jgi:hypothetical protein
MCAVVDLRPLAMVASTLSKSVIVHGPTRCALSLRDLPRRTVSSKSKPCRLSVVSSVLPFCRNAPCSCASFQLSFCVHADEPSVTGPSIRTRRRHNYTGVRAASSKQSLGLRGAQTATRREYIP